MISQDLLLAATPKLATGNPKGDLFHVVMLQLHVVMASIWLITALLTALMAVPRLRRVPSASGLHVLQMKREQLMNAVWGAYVLTLSSGIYLLFKQAAYKPPLSGSDWSALRRLPYGIPYYYALYGKIILFALMGIASLTLARAGNRAAKASEKAGGPVEAEALDSSDRMFLDDEVMPGGYDMADADGGQTILDSRVAAQRKIESETATGGWISVSMLVLGALGVGVCVTLIKYFHELSRSAVVYFKLTGKG